MSAGAVSTRKQVSALGACRGEHSTCTAGCPARSLSNVDWMELTNLQAEVWQAQRCHHDMVEDIWNAVLPSSFVVTI